MFWDSIKMSWGNIIHNKMRSFLTILGIVIGVASIIALITIVSGTTDSVIEEVSTLGADKITIMVRGTPLKQGLLDSEVKKLAEIDNVLGVSPSLDSKAGAVFDGTAMEEVSVQGRNDVYFTKTKDLVKAGRGINVIDCDNKSRVCLIGRDIDNELFFGVDPIGKKLKLGGVTFTIVGTLLPSQGFSFTNNNKAVIIPYTTAMSFFNKRYISSVDMYVDGNEYADQITNEADGVLTRAFNYNEDGYTITNMQNMLDTIERMTGMMSLMLAGIASISLIVGGIGIMNMMLVSVTERTTEIGLRKALGARPKRIQQQFLIEAMFLSVFGGAVGLILGILVAFVVCMLIGSSFSLSVTTVVLAIGFSMAIGVIFGLAPARKASRLNPIDALRSV